MAVKRRLSGFSGMRIDWPHLRSIESSVSFDFDSALRGLVTGLSQPYLLRGFKINIPNAAIAASALTISVADSAILHSSATESGTIFTVDSEASDEVLNSSNSNVIGSFQPGVPNYVSLDLRRITDTATIDQTAGWSQAQKAEFQRTAPIGRILQYRFIISTSGFSTNLPLYVVGTTGTGAVQYITKAVPSLFRLGRGGPVPDPFYSFTYKDLSNPQSPSQPRREWINQNPSLPSSMTVAPTDSTSAFDFGDFAITNLKEWMDAIMSRFKEITGSSYWYTDSSLLEKSPNLFDTWFDANGSVLTGSGTLSYNLVLNTFNSGYNFFVSSTISASAGAVYSNNSQTFTVLRTVSGSTQIQMSGTGTPTASGTLTKISGTGPATITFTAVTMPYGNLQSQAIDPSILTGDSYIIGLLSGNRATLQTFNFNQLVINSLTKTGFTYGETLYNRRIYRPNASLFKISSYNTGSNKLSQMVRLPQNTPVTVKQVSSWTYTPYGPGNGALLTINYSSAHGYQPGQYLEFINFQATSNAPTGVWKVKNVPSSTSIQICVSNSPTGTASVIGGSTGTRVDTSVRHPYLPSFKITSWTYSGTAITITAPNHNIISGQTIAVYGLTGATNNPNGRFVSVTVNTDRTISFTAPVVPDVGPPVPDPIVVSNAYCEPDVVSFLMTVTGSSPEVYNVTDQTTYAYSDTDLEYQIGSSNLPDQPIALGAITQDGVIAICNVSDPAKISSIAYISAPTPSLLVTTFSPHGQNTVTGPVSFTIYGETTISKYIATYSNVSIQSLNSTQFKIVGGVSDYGTYTNLGTDSVFASSPNNPFPGPVQWTSDLIDKAIIGDRYFKIPKTALADGTSLANQFNTNNVTGTAYLQNGEVAYVVLERNKSVSSGATFSTSGGASPIIGTSIPTYVDGNPLCVGDFVKFEDESENYWFRISNQGYSGLNDGDSLTGSVFYLIADNNQPPTSTQRPPKSGRLVYSKTQYNTVIVKPHWQVESNPDIYWIAVRRDNGSLQSKVYLKGLELSVGEVRLINDNTDSNILTFIGAASEAAVNPNYTVIDQSGQYQATQTLQVGTNSLDRDISTRTVTFTSSPDLSFQINDKIQKQVGNIQYTYTIKYVLSSRTVVMQGDISTLNPGDSVTYFRVNQNINDPDNLTLAIRKEDRSVGAIQTALNRPIYDESIYLQKMNISGSGSGIRSGSYIYQGTQNNPSALAWVCHGTQDITESIEGFNIGMPGGKFTSSSILISIVKGTFSHGSTIYQNGSSTGYTVNNPGNPEFTSPSVAASLNLEIVLPPNRRTQVVGGSVYVVWPSNAVYKASDEPEFAGEELLCIFNDTVRQARVDYTETFGGPKGKIQILRDLPVNTRMRFRILPAYGSTLTKLSGGVNLQTAYDGGNIINAVSGRPVDIRVSDLSTALIVRGGIAIGDSLAGPSNSKVLPVVHQAFDIGQENNTPNYVWASRFSAKTHTSHSGSAAITFTAADTSTNTSPRVITGSNVTIPNNYACRILVRAVARRSDGTVGGAAFTSEGIFYREGGGSPTAAASPMSSILGFYGDGSSYALAFGISGNDIVAVGYGGTGPVEWACEIEYQMVSVP